jgi:hypothetical protein
VTKKLVCAVYRIGWRDDVGSYIGLSRNVERRLRVEHEDSIGDALDEAEYVRLDAVLALLKEVAAVKRYNGPNVRLGYAASNQTLNMPIALLERIDAFLKVR